MTNRIDTALYRSTEWFSGRLDETARLTEITPRTFSGKDVSAASRVRLLGDQGSGTTGNGPPERFRTGPERATGADRPSRPHTRWDRADEPAAARELHTRTTAGDPVDVATGEVLLAETDVLLPGVLAMRLMRIHLSSYTAGRSFGRNWASTLDQRLEVGDQHIAVFGEDGSILLFPYPCTTTPVTADTPTTSYALSYTEPGDYQLEDARTGLRRSYRRGTADRARHGIYPLVALADRHGNQITFRRNVFGDVDSIVHSCGYRVVVKTDPCGTVRAFDLVDPTAPAATVRIRTFDYNPHGMLRQVSSALDTEMSFEYSDDAQLTAWTDGAGYTYRFHYDERGRCVAQGGSDGSLAATFRYRPTIDGGQITEYRNSLGAITTFHMDALLRVTAVTDPTGAVTAHSFDQAGRPVVRTDPLGGITRIEYGMHGDITSVTRADGSTMSATYCAPGLPSRITQYDGRFWSYTYGSTGRPDTVTDPCGATTHYRWHPNGALAAVVDPAGGVTRYDTDSAGLPIAVTDALGTVHRYRYDAFGRLTHIVDPSGAHTRMEWTRNGKLARRIFPDETVETWRYHHADTAIEHIDPMERTTRYIFGPFGRLTARIGADRATTSFEYDTELRLTTITDPLNRRWRYTYDPAGRLVSERDYDGRTLGYRYDPAGRLIAKVNGAGEQTTYHYDRLANLVAQHNDAGAACFTYDAMDRLVVAANADATVTFDRDALGRITVETCNGRTVRSTYDVNGHRTGRIGPTGVPVRWQRDSVGRVVRTTVGTDTITSTYDALGRESRRRLGDMLILRQEFTPAGMLARQIIDPPQERSTADHRHGLEDILLDRAYSYRIDNTVAHISDRAEGVRRYSLDAGHRVTAVSGPGRTETYRYDDAGNIVGIGLSGHADRSPTPWHAAANASIDDLCYTGTRLERAGAVRYRYDGQNRLVQRVDPHTPSESRYRWDCDDRLRAATASDGTNWTYHYDPFGRRIGKTQHSSDGRTILERIVFSWDRDQLAEQTTSTGATTTWTHDQRTGAPTSQRHHTTGDGGYTFHCIVTDLVGTPTHLVDPRTHRIVGRAKVTLWGVATWMGADTPLRFPGQYCDTETDLHYNRFRYYDPRTARYISTDPLGLAPAPDPTAYPSDPLRESDPFGLDPKQVDLFHGTDAINAAAIRANGVDPSRPSYPRDFGCGFYTTRERGQADEWASWYDSPVVLHFRLSLQDLNTLPSRLFTIDDRELAEFVRHYRSGATDTPYDMVEGPLLLNPKPFLQGAPPVWAGNQVVFFNNTGPLLDSALQA
ncbi:DUF6531 domain-containing protein [Nocardia sp. NPDC001965]